MLSSASVHTPSAKCLLLGRVIVRRVTFLSKVIILVLVLILNRIFSDCTLGLVLLRLLCYLIIFAGCGAPHACGGSEILDMLKLVGCKY